MSSSKTRQDGISTARKKWAIKDRTAAVPTDRRNGHRRDRPNRSALSAPDIRRRTKGVYFFATPVNERDLSSDINFSALIGASRSLSKRDFTFGMEITKVL
jgi:hypothetical protein